MLTSALLTAIGTALVTCGGCQFQVLDECLVVKTEPVPDDAPAVWWTSDTIHAGGLVARRYDDGKGICR